MSSVRSYVQASLRAMRKSGHQAGFRKETGTGCDVTTRTTFDTG